MSFSADDWICHHTPEAYTLLSPYASLRSVLERLPAQPGSRIR